MTKSPTRIFPSCYLSPVNIFTDLGSLSKVFNATGFVIKDLSFYILHNIMHFSLYHNGNDKVTDCNALASKENVINDFITVVKVA